MKRYILMLWLIGIALFAAAEPVSQSTTLRGTVTDDQTKEKLIGVSIYIPELATGAATDADGNYQISNLPLRTVTLQVSYIGHKTIIRAVDLAKTQQADFVMEEANAQLNEVVVSGLSGHTLLSESPSPVSVVSATDLQQRASTNIIDALAHLPGLSQVTTGSGISKPVIRGLGFNRIVTVDDGVRQEGQQWGDEHGIEIDANSVGQVEVLKGPASLMYGSDAMAGVVIFHHAPTLPEGTVAGGVTTEYQTNNGLFDYSLHIDGNHKGFVWGARYSEKMAHAYKNKTDGYVIGSQLHERALSGLLGLNRSWGYSHLRLSYYHLTPSMTELEEDEEGGDGTVSERPSHHQLTTYHQTLPFQQIHHYKVVWDNSVYIGKGRLTAIVGYQQNRRQEFEESDKVPGLDFMLHTVNYDLHYTLGLRRRWKATVGMGGMYQRSLNKGDETLIPAYALFDWGAFLAASKEVGRWNLSGGIRFDTRHLHAFAQEGKFDRFARRFNGVTGSLGAVYAVSPVMSVRLNLSRGFRAPNLSELGSNGEHEGTFRYETGNHNLKPENSMQVDIGWDYTSRYVTAQLALFCNRIDNYIFAGRQDRETDGIPTYQYQQGDARLLGGEALIDLHPVDRLHIENSFSYVDAVQLHQPDDTKYLPMTPAPRWNAEVRYVILQDAPILDNLYVRAGMECNLRQDHYYKANNTETATPSYTLFSLSAGTDVKLHGRKLFSLTVITDNLTDRAYQSHLSRLKYAGLNPWTSRQGFYNMGRNVTFKVSVPII